MFNFRKKSIVITVVFAFALFFCAGYVELQSSRVVPILMYHTFDELTWKGTPYTSPEALEKQLEFLHKYHYNVVKPDKIIDYMTGKEKMPAKTVAITADDGYYDFYEYAFPLLKRYKFPAAIFVVTDKIGKPGLLGWKELKEMSDSGLVEVGSHTKSHPWMPSVSVDSSRLEEELVLSKKILEEGLGKRVYFLCYPNGAFNDVVKDAARKAGYKGAFTTNPARRSDIHDIYAIRRIKMSSSSISPVILWGKISKYYTWFKERR